MARQPKLSTESIQLQRGHTRIVVVADTHSRPHPETHQLVRAQKPDAILHGGDIGDLSVLDEFAAIAPLITVRGNIDETTSHLPDFVTIHLKEKDAIRSCWLLTHIAVRGPKLRRPVAEMARLANAQMVVCGHSHVPLIAQDRGITIFNPGSCGPRRFSLPIIFGVIDISKNGLSLKHINCETGERWSPPDLSAILR